MSGSSSRIPHWISTGIHRFDVDHVTEKGQRSVSFKNVNTPSNGSPSVSTNESPEDPNSEPEPDELLVGCDNDLVITCTEQINRTFLQCQNLWQSYVVNADMLPSGQMPTASLEAYSVIRDVPPLPQDLYRRRIITGRALWRVPCPEFYETHESSTHDNDSEAWIPELVYGVDKSFPLWTESPTRCKISTRPDFRQFASGERPSEGPSRHLIRL